ncbi:8054_t:CDS:2, partial [Gigaspora rosea]
VVRVVNTNIFGFRRWCCSCWWWISSLWNLSLVSASIAGIDFVIDV